MAVSDRAALTSLIGLASSLPVPSVQALAASVGLKEVPRRYIRPAEVDADEVIDVNNADADHADVNVPVVDMARLLDPAFSEQEAAHLKMACENWGFFQLVNHGIEEVTDSMKDALQEFFKQPLEVRMKSAQPPDTVEGYGQAFVFNEEQELDWADMIFFYTQPCEIRNYDLWPKQPPTFRPSLQAYSTETKRVASHLLHHIAKNLGFDDPEKLTSLTKNGLQGMRMNYYPPCPLAHDKVIGGSPHSDVVALTLLLQANGVPGLQFRRRGKWLPVYPMPGAFTVIIGDVIEILSNGKYKSAEHRAMVNKDKERLSIAALHSLNLDATVGPLSDFCKERPPLFKSMSTLDYVRLVFASRLDGKSALDQMKLDA